MGSVVAEVYTESMPVGIIFVFQIVSPGFESGVFLLSTGIKSQQQWAIQGFTTRGSQQARTVVEGRFLIAIGIDETK